MEHLQQVQEILDGTDTRLVTLSVNPFEDDPESLKRYSSGFGVKPDSWFFWVGEEPATFQLIQAAYRSALVGVTPSEMSLLMRKAFESRVVAVDREGRVRGTYDLFSGDGRELLIEKLRQLNKE
jgi:cytochrome oxidase Cu insertion factor (SCO1/SenC/PrrC family)